MTSEGALATAGALPALPAARRAAAEGRALPLATVLAAVLILWYLGAIWMNASLVRQHFAQIDQKAWTTGEFIHDAWSLERPVLPAPQQVAHALVTSVFEHSITSRRSLVYHSYVTGSATVLGFALGVVLGISLAVGIVLLRTLDRSLLPWIIASQTVPIIAIAPMIVVVLGNMGLTGLIPKALISMYLCFFPITIGMVKGLRSPDPLQLDLMRTYSASPGQVFGKLRWPASATFLFASLKVAIAVSLVGAIVGELPTGAQAGLGALLLIGSYYGQTVQIWAALVMASLLGVVLVALVGLVERATLRHMGAMP